MDLDKDIYLQVVLQKVKQLEEDSLLLNAMIIQKNQEIEKLNDELSEYKNAKNEEE
jgi:hypothetical protein|nr:MAG TPA: hypothetical protein [Caudoviricetes sp.]DAI38432.1 MAG TPA: hypothetical protein [Caudoviricetes sp.]